MANIWLRGTEYPPGGSGRMGFDVTFGIWPVELGHSAGVVWTISNWWTVNWTNADWLYNVNNTYGGYDEVWKARIEFNSLSSLWKCWYALYVIDTNGNWFWDNNGGWNYEVKDPRYEHQFVPEPIPA